MDALIAALGQWAAALSLAPLTLGVIAKTKAAVAGRSGPPVLQPCFDLAKLLRKGAVYSTTTTWVFRAGPAAGLASALAAALVCPLGGAPPVSFPGDAVFFAAALGLGRFTAAAAALDAGSSFEGMGASRETAFASFAEPALILAFAALARVTGSLSLGAMFGEGLVAVWQTAGTGALLVAGALFIVLLAENSRVPVDDPATHLELTMIHEVMVLDHGGPDLALIQWGSALKLTLFASLSVRLLLPLTAGGAAEWALWAGGVLAVCVLVGLVESAMARLRLSRVPQLLVGAVCVAAFGMILALR